MFLIAYLLYHILSHLSRGFLKFFWWVCCLALGDFKPLDHYSQECHPPQEGGFCDPVIPSPTLFQPVGVWFTFVSRTGTPCGRVMGQKVLRLSWDFPLGLPCPPSPFVPLLYHNLRFVKRVFRRKKSQLFFTRAVSYTVGMVATHRLFGLVSQRGRLNSSGALPSLDTTDYTTSYPRLQ